MRVWTILFFAGLVIAASAQQFDFPKGKALEQQLGKPHVATNAEYRVFVNYVRDSIARAVLGEEVSDEFLKQRSTGEGEANWRLNWNEKIDFGTGDVREVLSSCWYPEHERYYNKREWDTRKLYYVYPDGSDTINIYPDTLAWLKHDSTSIENRGYQMALCWHYFTNQAFKNEPVVGVSPEQQRAYLHWRQHFHNRELKPEEQIRYRHAPETVREGKLPPGEPLWRITQNDWFEFLTYCRDSIAHRILGEEVNERHLLRQGTLGHEFPGINWKERINWKKLQSSEAAGLQEFIAPKMYVDPELHVDVRKILFEYYHFEFMKAALFTDPVIDRSVHIYRTIQPIYPSWSTWGKYVFLGEEPIEFYNWKTITDNEEVVGPNYGQILAYLHWRADRTKKPDIRNHWFPTSSEWKQYQAGDLSVVMKPVVHPNTFGYIVEQK